MPITDANSMFIYWFGLINPRNPLIFVNDIINYVYSYTGDSLGMLTHCTHPSI